MPIRTVGEYLKRWGIRHKTAQTRHEQDPQAVKAWLETEYPALENALLLSRDCGEMNQTAPDAQVGRGYAPIDRPQKFNQAPRK